MPLLARLAPGLIALVAVGCSSSSGGSGGADAGGGADGTVDSSGNDATGGDDATSGVDVATGGDAPHDAMAQGDATKCTVGFELCHGNCVNENNDILNCGGCDIPCMQTNPYCDNGTCKTAPCSGTGCANGQFCCGTGCCAAGQLCCDVPSNIPTTPQCTTPVNGTCPVGCPVCP